jgi:Spy/CpxP family protein refolding chaperone
MSSQLIRILLVLGAASTLNTGRASEAPADPLAGAFFPPELIVMAHAEIGLTPAQRDALQARLQKTQPRSDELRQQLGKETAALSQLARQDKVDEVQVVAQLDRVLDVERELKHLQIGLLAGIKNLLTPDQLARLREFQKGGGGPIADEMRRRLSNKVAQVEAGAHAWEANGRDTSEIALAMQERVKPLLDAGKPIEAEAELDRLLQKLAPDSK